MYSIKLENLTFIFRNLFFYLLRVIAKFLFIHYILMPGVQQKNSFTISIVCKKKIVHDLTQEYCKYKMN